MKRPKNVSLIIIDGPSGAGKTTLADLLHDELAYTAHIGVDHIKRFISEFRDVPSHNEVSKDVVNAMVSEYLKRGISVIVEQALSSEEIKTLHKIAKDSNAKCFVYQLEAPREILNKRIAERTEQLNKPVVSKEFIDTSYRDHQETKYADAAILSSDELSTQDMTDHILKDLL